MLYRRPIRSYEMSSIGENVLGRPKCRWETVLQLILKIYAGVMMNDFTLFVELLCKMFPTTMHRLMILKTALQSYSIFRHVSVVATTIIREGSQTVLSWKQRCYTAQFVLLCTRNRIHFTVSINIEPGKHWVCGDLEIVEPPPKHVGKME